MPSGCSYGSPCVLLDFSVQEDPKKKQHIVWFQYNIKKQWKFFSRFIHEYVIIFGIHIEFPTVWSNVFLTFMTYIHSHDHILLTNAWVMLSNDSMNMAHQQGSHSCASAHHRPLIWPLDAQVCSWDFPLGSNSMDPIELYLIEVSL